MLKLVLMIGLKIFFFFISNNCVELEWKFVVGGGFIIKVIVDGVYLWDVEEVWRVYFFYIECVGKGSFENYGFILVLFLI